MTMMLPVFLKIILPFLCLFITVHQRSFHSSRPCRNDGDAGRTGSDMFSQLAAKIKMGGPLTVADYMREVLTNPSAVSHILS